MLVVLLSFTVVTSACSSSDKSDKETSSSGQAQTTDKAADESKFPRTIQTANGDVTINEKPKKVAVVHWGYGDSLLLFDLESVGIALPFTEQQSVLHSDQYKPYVDKVKDLQIVGENTQVDLEKLLAYGPDLIIAGNAINKDVLGELSKIAQTVVIDEAQTDVWSNWPALVTKFGEILGQEDVAADYIAKYQADQHAGKEKLSSLNGTVAFVQVREQEVYLQGTNYTKQYYEGLGLTPPQSNDMADGAKISLEGLAALDPDYLFLGYFNYSDKSMAAATDAWEDSEVWKKLKAVQNGHVYSINGELALGYGPIGNSYGVQAVIDELSK
ncbi:ABC transporter substrate-binding protein [Paenibacillus cellulosilyticus]|nr:ABC transporter substrate-binding protein [Paenibacillus cellulosilyticus]